MAKKMYYTEEEAASKLGINVETLAEYVRDQRLRVFKDGARNMYKADEVDALAGTSEEMDIELTPADTGAPLISLSDADIEQTGGKEDTIITAEGISIFDEEDLEVETADPMAKTQIAPSLEDQISLEGVGSGSGLLDLTRESDNTSLGPALDGIDLEESPEEIPSIEEPPAMSAEAFVGQTEAAVVPAQPVTVEAADPSAGLFNGILVGCFILTLLIGGVTMAAAGGTLPGYLEMIDRNPLIVLGGGAVMVAVCGVLGLMLGKVAAPKRA